MALSCLTYGGGLRRRLEQEIPAIGTIQHLISCILHWLPRILLDNGITTETKACLGSLSLLILETKLAAITYNKLD